jgi:Peptidase M1 N-terminal domain
MKMRRSSVLCRSAVIFLFIAVSLVKCQSSPNYRLSANVIPSSYDLHIVVDLVNAQFNGTVTIQASANQPTSAIELHLLDLSTSDVEVFEGVSAVGVSSLQLDNETQIFRVGLARAVIGDFIIKMSFEGEIKDDMKGLYRSSYYEGLDVK